LIIVAPADRKFRIEVGMGLEALLTDAKAGTIIQHTMPLFGPETTKAGLVRP